MSDLILVVEDSAFFYVCDMLMKMLNFGQSFVNNQKRKFAWLGPLLPCGWPRLDRVALTEFGRVHFGVFSMILHDLRYQHGAPNSVHDKKSVTLPTLGPNWPPWLNNSKVDLQVF